MNRLASAMSPFLLQHAGNPVDWYEWGEEAFRRAIGEAGYASFREVIGEVLRYLGRAPFLAGQPDNRSGHLLGQFAEQPAEVLVRIGDP